MSNEVLVVGGGLAGAMCALMLSKRGLQVTMVEKRPDFRKTQMDDTHAIHGQLTNTIKRSINLALSHRGICALEKVGLAEKIKEIALPMYGRMIHKPSGQQQFQPYGLPGQAINSVSRGLLNAWLLDAAEKEPGVKLYFSTECKAVSEDGTAVLSGGVNDTKKFDLIVGADGVFSQMREVVARHTRLSFRRNYIDHGYKELTIPPTKDGDYAMDYSSLHIWPRHEFMMIALPNPDRTFTCTLFMPLEGENCFDSYKTDEEILAFFNQTFPDAVPLMPTLVEDYKQNKASSLLTIHCTPWHAAYVASRGPWLTASGERLS